MLFDENFNVASRQRKTIKPAHFESINSSDDPSNRRRRPFSPDRIEDF